MKGKRRQSIEKVGTIRLCNYHHHPALFPFRLLPFVFTPSSYPFILASLFSPLPLLLFSVSVCWSEKAYTSSFFLYIKKKGVARACMYSYFYLQPSLSLELLETAGLGFVELARDKGKRYDAANVHLGTKDMGIETELLSGRPHVLETLLVVRASTADPDGHLVLNEGGGNLVMD